MANVDIDTDISGRAAAESRIDRLAAELTTAHLTDRRLSLPSGAHSMQSVHEAYAVQDRVVDQLGPITAWKVGLAKLGPEAPTPICAPIAQQFVRKSGTSLELPDDGQSYVEGELAFRLLIDLPPRAGGYARSDFSAGTVAPCLAIEVAGSRFDADLTALPKFDLLADGGANRLLVCGRTLQDWTDLEFSSLEAELVVGGDEPLEARSSGADPVHLLAWLANHVAERRGGLRTGDVVTTGSIVAGRARAGVVTMRCAPFEEVSLTLLFPGSS